jgi:2,4-dienoyl-CoA reductase (NADPH2)
VALFEAAKGTIDPETLAFLVFHRAEPDDKLHELVEKGCKEITILERLPKAGRDLGKSSRWVILLELERRGVRILTGMEVTGIEAGTVRFSRRLKDGSASEGAMEFDSVVLALGAAPVDPLSGGLERAGIPVTRAGDCTKPGRILDAIHAGHAAGRGV